MLQVIIMSAIEDRREWLQTVLRASPVIEISGVAPTFPYLRSLIDDTSPDAVVIDLQSITDADVSREWVVQILDLVPAVLLTPQTDRSLLEHVLQAGAGALLGSDAAAEQIIHAIEAASADLITIDGQTVTHLEDDSEEAPEELTSRETEVLRLLAEGFPNRDIAYRLQISEHTIKFHIRSILGKLGASSRTEAVTRGFRAGLIDL